MLETEQTAADPALDAELKTEEAAADEAVTQAKAGPLPASVTLAAPYGFIDDDGVTNHFWQANEVVTDPALIAVLVGRKAPVAE